MNIDEYRNRIDRIEKQLVTLFCELMYTASDIAVCKK